jgi:hypothetical protein
VGCALTLLATACVHVLAWRSDGDDERLAREGPPKKKDEKKPARRLPKVLNVEEAKVALARVQVRAYLLEEIQGNTYVAVIETGGKLRRKPIDKVGFDEPLATRVLPLRMAVVAAAFPYKAQVREFRDKLALGSDEEVLALAAFRFLGVTVERRELDAEGRPVVGEGGRWRKLDLEEDFAPYAFATGRDFEPEDAELAPVSVRGLVMPRLRQARRPARPEKDGEDDSAQDAPSQYPVIERDLEKLAPALEKLRPPSARFGDLGGRFDPFGGVAPPREGKGEAKPQQKKPLPEHCLVRVVDVTVQPGRAYEYRLKVRMANPNFGHTGAPSADLEALESAECSSQKLVLRLDPELCYYAVNQEAVAKYEAEKYADRYSKDASLDPYRMTFFQAHRWVELARLPTVPGWQGFSGLPRMEPVWVSRPVGEWVIAERFPVYRGEVVGRPERVSVPYWESGREDFVLAREPTKLEIELSVFRGLPGSQELARKVKPNEPRVPFDFGHERNDSRETLLVDFDSGRPRSVWVGDVSKGRRALRRIEDEWAGEALLLSPDGKLLLRETRLDAADEDRIERLKAARGRIHALEERDREAQQPRRKGRLKVFPP